MVGVELHRPGRDGGQFVPGAVAGVRLVDEVQQGTILHLQGLVDKVGVCRPGEVDDVFGHEVPIDHAFRGRGTIAVSVAAVLRVLQDPGATDHVGGGHVDGHVIVAPHAVEFPADVGVGVPTVVVVFAQPRVPLGHAVFDPLLVHPAGAADLPGNLGVPFEVQADLLARGEGLGQVQPTDGSLRREGGVGFAHAGFPNADPAPFFFGQLDNAVSDAGVRIGDVPAADVHHASRLEGIEKEVERDALQHIGTVVDVGQVHDPGILVHVHIHGDVHGAVHLLLPTRVLGVQRGSEGEQKGGEAPGGKAKGVHVEGKVAISRPAGLPGGRSEGGQRLRSGP